MLDLRMGLSFTKLYSLFFKTEIRIGMVGLDAAGKTTILYKLKLGKIVTTIPTIGFNYETLEYKNISFIVWDAGVYAMFRMQSAMSQSYQDIQGLIFVVDSADRERVVDAKDELHRIMLKEEGLKDKALIVFANKQDRPGAMSTDEIIEKLDLHSLGLPNWHIQSTSATSGEGLYEGLDWLANNIDNKA